MRSAIRFILDGPELRSKLWRLAYILDYHGPKWLKGNQKGSGNDC